MGLYIRAITTGEGMSYSYSRLHHNARYLALLFCGMPEYLDDDNKESALVFYMNHFIGNKKFNTTKLGQFLYALRLSGIEFPNLLLHSDCEGTYTKNGKLDLYGNLMTGNSKKLLKELKKLISEPVFQQEKYSSQLDYTKEFYTLVKNEVENGKGIISFS